jgi:hypothetical protein
MPDDLVEYWLKSGRNAYIAGFSLKSIEHKNMKGKPLSSQKGQATVYFLIADNGQWWLLKKFHNNQSLNKKYLNKIKRLLPENEGLTCGTKREVLSCGALNKTAGFHYSNELDNWLDGTILMQKVDGYDWACLADDLRSRAVQLDTNERLTLCLKLTELIKLLEEYQCCHRDLSCGNVFIDCKTSTVSLIDFDSLYHPSLKMPRATTCGTTGYTCHLAWTNGQPDPKKTWCLHADRFALAILIAEFLLIEPNAKSTGEGGIFDQEELKNQGGKNLDLILEALNAKLPLAAQMLEAAVKCSSFSDCPSPQDWLNFYKTVPGFITVPPSLSDMPEISGEMFQKILNACRPALPIQPAPSLSELQQYRIQLPQIPKVTIPKINLPPNSWQKRN